MYIGFVLSFEQGYMYLGFVLSLSRLISIILIQITHGRLSCMAKTLALDVSRRLCSQIFSYLLCF